MAQYFTGRGGCSGEGPRKVILDKDVTSVRKAEVIGWGYPRGPYVSKGVAEYAIAYDISDPEEAERKYNASRRDR